MEAHTKVDLTCITKPYTDVVWKVWLLGINPRSSIFSPFFLLFLLPFPGPPLFLALFSLLYWYSIPLLHLRVSFSLFGAITRPINPHVRVVGKSWIAWYGVWACQVLGSTLWCWQLSRLYCSCTEFVLFFRRFVRRWAWGCPRLHSWAVKGFSLYLLGSRAPRLGLWALNVKWVEISNFRPHKHIHSFFLLL